LQLSYPFLGKPIKGADQSQGQRLLPGEAVTQTHNLKQSAIFHDCAQLEQETLYERTQMSALEVSDVFFIQVGPPQPIMEASTYPIGIS